MKRQKGITMITTLVIIIVLVVVSFGIYINFKEQNNNQNEIDVNSNNNQQEYNEKEVVLPTGEKLNVTTTTCMLGDVYEDGKINTKDFTYLNKIVRGEVKASTSNLSCGDVDNDGKLTENDSILLQKFAASNEFAHAPLTEISYGESSKKTCLLGDVTGDGEIASIDGTKILRVVEGLEKSSKLYEVCGDVNNDGKLTKEDAEDILRYKVDSFPKHTPLESVKYTSTTSNICYLGDLTGDKRIDALDLLRLNKVISGDLAKTSVYITCGDINGDSKLNEEDKTILQKYIAGITEFPKGKPLSTISYKDHTLEKSCKLGDVNGDGKINSLDSMITLRVVGGEEKSTSIYENCGDVDGNGKLTESDANMILNYSAKTISTFPKGTPLKEIKWVEETTLTCKLGDATGDGKINSSDVSLVKSLVPGTVTMKQRLPYVCGDVDGDGKLGNNDYELLNNYVNGYDTFPGLEDSKRTPLLKMAYKITTTTTCKFGDVKEDGSLNNKDSMQLYYIISGKESATEASKTCGDINGDGKLSQEDVDMLFSYLSGTYEFVFKKGKALTKFEYEESSDASKTCKFGDLNNDGKISKLDVDIFKSFIDDNKKPSEMHLACGDINGNKMLESDDMNILNNYVEKKYNFPKGEPLEKITYITTDLLTLQNMIVSDNKNYGLYYKKVSVNNKDNTPLITLSIGDYVKDNKIDLNNTIYNGSYDNTYKLSGDSLNRYMNSKYNTNISYTTSSNKLFKFDGGYAKYENGIYYLSKQFAGTGYSYDITNEVIKGEIIDDKIYLYDIALIKLDEPGMTSYYDSFDSDEMIYSCNEKCSLDDDSVFNKYKSNLGVYKHSFNMLNDGTIYYFETQKID